MKDDDYDAVIELALAILESDFDYEDVIRAASAILTEENEICH